MFWLYPTVSHDLRHFVRLWRPALRLIPQDIETSVNFGAKKFQADLDVQHYKPENISIKVTDDNVVTVEGKHEEKQDGEGYISRHFVRRFVLPKGHDMSKVESQLSSDGVLSITAPRVVEEDVGRKIDIKATGKPYNKTEE